jgi:hypothetical protein
MPRVRAMRVDVEPRKVGTRILIGVNAYRVDAVNAVKLWKK